MEMGRNEIQKEVLEFVKEEIFFTEITKFFGRGIVFIDDGVFFEEGFQ